MVMSGRKKGAEACRRTDRFGVWTIAGWVAVTCRLMASDKLFDAIRFVRRRSTC
jgi:hypothetical protein